MARCLRIGRWSGISGDSSRSVVEVVRAVAPFLRIGRPEHAVVPASAEAAPPSPAESCWSGVGGCDQVNKQPPPRRVAAKSKCSLSALALNKLSPVEKLRQAVPPHLQESQLLQWNL